MKTACFTGHRPQHLAGYDEEHPMTVYIKQRLREEILAAIENGYTDFIFGGALGVDTWAGEIIADLRDHLYCGKIRLILYSPFEGQESKWNDESKLRYFNLMSRCDDIVTVCEDGYAPWKLLKRDDAMVDNSSLLIAVWNGKENGGTYHTIQYAKKRNVETIRIDPNIYAA
ncbi:hypothetical protein D3C72_1058200 [compost metagenome]